MLDFLREVERDMKKLLSRKNILKEAGVLMTVILIVLSITPVPADTINAYTNESCGCGFVGEGNTLITEAIGNRVIEVCILGNIIWQTTGLNYPYDAERLANGHTLITEPINNRVIEVDSSGAIVWDTSTYLVVLNHPMDAERLANGNTLIANMNDNSVIEINSVGIIEWSYSTGLWNPIDVERLASGNTLITDRGNHRVIEVNTGGSIVGSYASGLNNPWDAERLANGNTLIVDTLNQRIIEVDFLSGNIYWNFPTGNSPYDAERLENGNTLITEYHPNYVYEIDTSGTIVWERTGLNCPADAERLNCSCCPDGMISYWKLDETTGNVIDSFNGNHGTNVGATRGITGQVGNAFNFAGDHVEIPGASLNLGTGAFTLEAWIFLDSTPGANRWPAIMSKRGDPSGLDGFLFSLLPNTGEMHIQIDGSNQNPGPVVTPQTWHHVAITRDGTTITYYLDGSQGGNANSGNNMDSPHALWLGDDEPSPHQHNTAWNGIIDEVAVWSECLTAAEIACHYNAGLMGRGYDCIDIDIQTGFGSGINALLTNNCPCDTGSIQWRISWDPIFIGPTGSITGTEASIPANGGQVPINSGLFTGFGFIQITVTADCAIRETAWGFIIWHFVWVF